jgi:hypothetical protein
MAGNFEVLGAKICSIALLNSYSEQQLFISTPSIRPLIKFINALTDEATK